MSDAVYLPRGWTGRRVEVESRAGEYDRNERREGEIVGALDSGLVLRSRVPLRLYPWSSIRCVKLIEDSGATAEGEHRVRRGVA